MKSRHMRTSNPTARAARPPRKNAYWQYRRAKRWSRRADFSYFHSRPLPPLGGASSSVKTLACSRTGLFGPRRWLYTVLATATPFFIPFTDLSRRRLPSRIDRVCVIYSCQGSLPFVILGETSTAGLSKVFGHELFFGRCIDERPLSRSTLSGSSAEASRKTPLKEF